MNLPLPSPPHPAYAWISLAWCLPGVVAALQYTVLCPYPTPAGVSWYGARALVVGLLTWQIWALFTPLVLRVLGRWPLSPWSIASTLVHLALATVLAQVHIVAAVWGRQWLFGEPWPDLPTLRREFEISLQARLLLEIAIYGVVVALAEVRRQRQQTQAERVRLGEVERELAGAQLEALRGQLQPHFLFNALNAVAVLAQTGQSQAAAATVTDLSELLRRSLEIGPAAFVPLREEVEFGAQYLSIEQRRFGAERLDYACELAPDTLPAQIPALLLQPILENAVRHGIEQRTERGGRVRVVSRRQDDRLQIEVSDNGPGPGQSSKAGHGIGLANLRARLRQLYRAEAFRLDCRAESGGGYLVQIELPFRA